MSRSPNTPVRVAIVGAGNIARRHAESWNRSEHAELVGFVDLVREKAEERAAAFGGTAAVSLEELREATAIDLVDVCTREPHHAEPAIAARRAGYAVQTEKLMAHSMEAGLAMVRTQRERGGFCGMQYNYRSVPGIAELQRIRDEGRFGALRQLTVTGAVQCFNHLMDSALAIAGTPLSVSAAGELATPEEQTGVDPEIVYQPGARFSAAIECVDDCLLVMNASRASNFKQLPFHLIASFEQETVVLDGLSWPNEVLGNLRLLPNGEPLLKTSAFPSHHTQQLSFDHAMNDCARRVAAGEPPRSSWEDGWKVMLVSHACALALTEGRRIDLGELRARIENDTEVPA